MSDYVTREQVMQALLDLFTPLTDFKIVSRRLQHWSDVNGADQPALYIYEKPETHKRADQVTPAIRMLTADIFIYINVGNDPSAVPATQLNNLIDLIDPNSGGVLFPDVQIQNRQTLGGLVYDCWIEGDILKVPGDLDGQGIAVIPVKILIP